MATTVVKNPCWFMIGLRVITVIQFKSIQYIYIYNIYIRVYHHPFGHLCFVHRRGKCWGPPADPKWLLRFQNHFWQKISCWNFVQGWLLLMGFQIYDSIRFQGCDNQIFSCPIPRRFPWTPFTAALLSIALLFCVFRPEVPVRRIDFSSKSSHSSYCFWSFIIYIY